MVRYSWMIAAAALLATAGRAQAEDYAIGVSLLGGFTDASDVRQLPTQTGTLKDDTDTLGVSGGVGLLAAYDLQRATGLPFSLELSSNWRLRHDLNIIYTDPVDIHNAKLNVMTLDNMLSILWHIPTGTRFTPYIGGGGGMAFISSDNETISGFGNRDEGTTTDWNPAWQLQAGTNYSVSPRWDVRVDYRYIDMGTITSAVMYPTSSTFEADVVSHDIRLAALWKF